MSCTKVLFTLVLLIHSKYSIQQVANCGAPQVTPKSGRIINGIEATPNSWPYVVSLDIANGRCGGVLLDTETVLTAAHCFPSANPNLASISIFIGVHDLSTDINNETTFGARSVFVHPRYNTNTFENDMAIIKLNREARPSRNVSYICFEKKSTLTVGENLTVIGWGNMLVNNAMQLADKLMQVNVPNRNVCAGPFNLTHQICAGDVANTLDSCQGDSGGPLMKRVNNRWTVVGVVSFGDANCTGAYAIYGRVDYYYDWIKNYTLPVIVPNGSHLNTSFSLMILSLVSLFSTLLRF